MTSKRFRIAFSFAGEQRAFVMAVAEALAARFGHETILYDKFHEAEFARHDLGLYLPKLYGQQSDLIVPVICPDYDPKRWTGWEWLHIYGLLTKADGHRVMPCRFKHALADGLSPAAGFVELDDKSPEAAAQLILERLAINEGKPRDYYFSQVPPPKPAPLVWPTEDPDWMAKDAAYRQHLVDRFGKLTLYSLSSDQPIAVDLEQVFVKLTTVEKQSRSERVGYSHELAEKFLTGDRAGLAESERVPGMTHYPRVAPAKPVQEVEVTLTLPEALRAHAHLAIIGAPGAGKTTALKWLALAYARRQVKERLALEEDRLPLFVALRDFNRFLDNLEKTTGLPSPLPPALLARHLQEYYAEHVQSLPLPPDFFLRALAAGQALVLLDGLDEVAVASKRTRAAEFVAACVRAYPQCRFVLSSRPRGYENDCRTHLAALCSECRVRDFDDADIAALSTNWYLAVTIAREGDNPTTRDRAASAAKNLQAAVKQERVRPLAANPLLLSILALIHQKGVGLPQRRVELYQECTEFLLGYWDQVRGGDTGHELAKLGGLTRQEKCALLEPIALWIHERGEKGTEVSRKELEAQLAEQFRDRFAETDARAGVRAKEFVDIIEQRAGLIVEREQDTFAFTHLTFQEYLAARALSDREDFVAQTLEHLHDPWWREVHLLEVAHLSTPNTRRSREDTSKLLAAIQGAGSRWESDIHRDLLFAFHALCDVGLLGVETAFRQGLTQTVFMLWQKSEGSPIESRLAERFSYAGATPVGSLLVESLLPLTRNKTVATRYRAVAALGRLGSAAAITDVLVRLLALIQDDNDDVRSRAAEALGKLGSAAATPDVLARLLALIQDANDDVRSSAAIAMGNLGSAAATPDVLARLVALSQDANDHVRSRAAYALGYMGSAAATPDVLARLVALSQDANDDVRSSAAYALGKLGSAAATPDVLARLLALSQDANDDMRSRAAFALGYMGNPAATPEVLARLLALSQDANDDVRSRAAFALGYMGNPAATPEALARLLALSQDANDGVRFSAAGALGNMGNAAATPEILARLLALSQDANDGVRYRASSALGDLGSAAATPDVLARLLALIQDAHDDVRYHALSALGNLGSAAATPDVLARLLALIQDANGVVRSGAASALGNLGGAAATPDVLARLLALIQDANDDVRYSAASALGNLGGAAATPDVLARLLALIQDANDDVRSSAAGALGQMTEAMEPKQVEILATWSQKNLANESALFIGGNYQQVSKAAFDILHRLAARMPRTEGAAGKGLKAKGKKGSRAAQSNRAQKAKVQRQKAKGKGR